MGGLHFLAALSCCTFLLPLSRAATRRCLDLKNFQFLFLSCDFLVAQLFKLLGRYYYSADLTKDSLSTISTIITSNGNPVGCHHQKTS